MGFDIKHLIPYLWSVLFGNNSEQAKSLSGITIALVGRSGSGMSTLIRDATGSYETGVAPDEWRSEHLTEPYTDNIQSQGYTVPGVSHTDFPLIFIDTPGFVSLSQNNIHAALRRLHEWLKKFKPRTRLDGLIFMLDVSTENFHNRPAYAPPRDNILEKLCGSNWSQKVVFVSSHWDQLHDAGQKDVQAQIEKYWGVMQRFQDAPGLREYKYPGTSASAWEILRPLVKGALDFRKEKLDEELDSLRDRIPSTLHDRVKEVVGAKMVFMQQLIPKLGDSDATAILTDEGRDLYKKLNQEAMEVWRRVENELDIVELERLLAAGLTSDSDRIRKINIAVVGSIGSGKSQFVHDVTDQRKDHVASEANVHPHTKEFNDEANCTISAAELNSQFDYLVNVIDTPGFDYLNLENDEKKGFDDLLNWTRKRYGGPRLDGIVYLHSIQHEELGARKSFFHYSQLLRNLWHEEWLRHIVFVSSFWSQDYQDPDGKNMSIEAMVDREKRIRESYCDGLAKVHMMRYNGKPDGSDKRGAKEILLTILLQFL